MQESLKWINAIRKKPISGYDIGDVLYVDVRCYGCEWYSLLLTNFPDRFYRQYVLRYEVTGVCSKYVCAYCEVYDEIWTESKGINCLDAYWCYAWGSCRALNLDTMTLITPALCKAYPEIISADPVMQQRVLHKHFPKLY